MFSIPNRIIRLNPLYLLFAYGVFFVFLYFSLSNYQRAFAPPYSFDGEHYRICPNFVGCKTYSKEEVDNPSSINSKAFINDRNFQKDLELAKSNQITYRGFFYFVSLLSAGYLIIATFLWFMNKVSVKDNAIIINSLLPPIRSTDRVGNLTIIDIFRWKTTRNAIILVEKINAIKVVTTTPLIPDRTDISQINWRDRVYISYRQDDGTVAEVVVELFIFPGFKKTIKDIVLKYPLLKVSFSKETFQEKVKDFTEEVTIH